MKAKGISVLIVGIFGLALMFTMGSHAAPSAKAVPAAAASTAAAR